MPEEPQVEGTDEIVPSEPVRAPSFMLELPNESWALYLVQICRVALGQVANSREGQQVLAVMSLVEGAIDQHRRAAGVVNQIALKPDQPKSNRGARRRTAGAK